MKVERITNPPAVGNQGQGNRVSQKNKESKTFNEDAVSMEGDKKRDLYPENKNTEEEQKEGESEVNFSDEKQNTSSGLDVVV